MDRPAGGWLELSVSAGDEAVEAVSEIFARVATGITVEPAFVPTDEGLGARLDPTRPAIVRAYLAAGDDAAVEAAVVRTETALGHLQAFGLGPIGDLQRTRRRAGRVGRRVEAALPAPAHRPPHRHPPRLAAPPPTPRGRGAGARPGPGIRHGSPPHDASVPRRRGAPRRRRAARRGTRPRRGLRVGHPGPRRGRLRRPARPGAGHGPAGRRGDPPERPAQRVRAPREGAPGVAAARPMGRTTSSSPTSSPRCWSASRVRSTRPPGRAGGSWRAASSPIARPTCAARCEPRASPSRAAWPRASG